MINALKRTVAFSLRLSRSRAAVTARRSSAPPPAAWTAAGHAHWPRGCCRHPSRRLHHNGKAELSRILVHLPPPPQLPTVRRWSPAASSWRSRAANGAAERLVLLQQPPWQPASTSRGPGSRHQVHRPRWPEATPTDAAARWRFAWIRRSQKAQWRAPSVLSGLVGARNAAVTP